MYLQVVIRPLSEPVQSPHRVKHIEKPVWYPYDATRAPVEFCGLFHDNISVQPCQAIPGP